MTPPFIVAAAPAAGIRRPHWFTLCLFFIGAALAMCFLKSMYEWPVVLAAGALCSAVWLASGLAHARAPRLRLLGFAAWAFLLAFYALWAYLAVVVGCELTWTIPLWGWVLVAISAVAAIATALRPRHAISVPIVLPVGIWIALAFAGWLREETRLRCDDRDRLQWPARLVVSNPQLAGCAPGEVRPSGRFPRTIWEAPDADRLVFTTQGEFVDGGLAGSICEVTLPSDAPPVCIGPPYNKSQGLIDLHGQNRLIAMQWGVATPSGSRGAIVFELRRDPGLTLLSEHWYERPIAEGFYEPRNATLYMFSDEMDAIYRAVLPDFTAAPPLPVPLVPGEIRYDQERGEGVLCGGKLGVAVRGDPFSVRYFVDANASPIDQLSTTWGCDWDPQRRKVYTTVANLGLLDRIDYDSGRVEKRWFVGPGMRSVAYDPLRRRVYMGEFLPGYVLAFDEDQERVVERWFVGRFTRWVHLTRDGRALLATGNLGIVRIALPD